MKDLLKKSWPDALVIVGFLALSFLYFFTPLSQNLVLGGHDTVAGMGQGQEQLQYFQSTGEISRWTNSIFSGMPTYQISPTYGPTSFLSKIGWILGLFTTGPLNYVFIYLLGFYILMRSFKLRPEISALGSVLWAFSSYFFIIIAAGHIWKVNTLGFIPPTIAGLVLAYRGKYLWGCLVTALFTALQVLCNHIQMTYYFLFVMAFICLAYGVDAILKKELKHWGKATAAIVLGGLLGAAINSPNLYHTWEYSKQSMRGPSELVAVSDSTSAGAAASTGGLDRDYITAWSYGIDETMTLMIPMYKGGGSSSIFDYEGAEDLKAYDEFSQSASQAYQALQGQASYLPGTMLYWGDQPMTVGPVYVGAIVCFLFFLGIFFVRGPMKWALVFATLLSFLFAWGRNIMPLTDFFIDHLPMYNKFRTVSSALVVAEFTMPLLGILGLAEILKDPKLITSTLRGKVGFGVSLAITAGSCLLFAVVPSMADCISGQDMDMLQQMKNAGFPFDFVESYRSAIITMHESILSASAWRSFFLIALAGVVVYAYSKRPNNVPAWSVVAILLIVSLADMWNINKNYLNDDNFEAENVRLEGFEKTPADKVICEDKDLDYRVLNLSAGNPFNESTNQTAYWHKSIGGYHAAKLHRYQDLIDHYLGSECNALMRAVNQGYADMTADSVAFQNYLAHAVEAAPADADQNAVVQSAMTKALMERVNTDSISPILNMLNAKWLIAGQGGQMALENPGANGSAWFVNKLSYVENANAEMAALGKIDTKHEAVADQKFKEQLGTDNAVCGEGTVIMKSYQPNELAYSVDSKQGGVVVFSEVYYPGWTATIDGQDAEVGRVNYILRALRVPAGKHEVVLTFKPASVTATDTVAYTCIALLLAGFLFAFYRLWKKKEE